MTHLITKVTGFKLLDDFVIRVRFDDGTEQTINFLPVLTGELFEPLRDPKLFSKVKIDPEAHTLCWPNGADFCPDLLYTWTSGEPVLRPESETVAS